MHFTYGVSNVLRILSERKNFLVNTTFFMENLKRDEKNCLKKLIRKIFWKTELNVKIKNKKTGRDVKID